MISQKKIHVHFWGGLLLIAVFGALLRIGVTLTGLSFGTDDEATFGLMALHILAGKGFPLMGWGAHYGGTLQSYLAVPLFAVFGSSFTALKLSVLPFSVGLLILIGVYVRRIADEKAALAAAAFAAVPAPYLLAYAVNGFGIYAQIPFFTILLLILTDRLSFDEITPSQKNTAAFFWGLTAGIATWTLPLFVVVILACVGQFLLCARRRFSWGSLGLGLLGGGIGLLPFVVYNLVVVPGGSFLRLGARVVGTNRSAVQTEGLNAVGAALEDRLIGLWDLLLLQFKNLAPLFGLERLSVVLALLVLLFLALFVVVGIRQIFKDGKAKRFTALFLLVPISLLFSLVAALDRPRTLVAIYLAVIIFAGAGVSSLWRLERRILAVGMLVFLLTVNLFLVRPYLKSAESSASENAVVEFLLSQNIHHVYSEIGFAMPLMFLTEEEILASTELARTLIERHPTANREVAESDHAAVLLHASNPNWNEALQERLRTTGIFYETKDFSPFIVLYNFDPPLKPEILAADGEDEGEE